MDDMLLAVTESIMQLDGFILLRLKIFQVPKGEVWILVALCPLSFLKSSRSIMLQQTG